MIFGKNKTSDKFFDLLTKIAGNLIEGSNFLQKIAVSPPAERPDLRDKLHVLENSSDDMTHNFMHMINQTFVTPLDRDDLTALAYKLDDCMDYIDEAANLIVVYKIDTVPEGVIEQVNILVNCSELTAKAMPHLATLDQLREYWVEINRLENQADQAYVRTLSELFDNVKDPIELIKLKDIVHSLEKACDAYEQLATTIEDIHVKES